MSSSKKKELPTNNSIESLVEGIKESLGNLKLDLIHKPSDWFLPSGNLALDYIISMRVDGSGGYPNGRIIEIFGDPSTGKTILLMKAGAAIQSKDGIFVIADAENRWDVDFATTHGVDDSKAIRFCPRTIEDFTVAIYDILIKYGESKRLLVVLDSLAAISTVKEIEDVQEGEMKADQGRRAQKIKAALRILPSLVSKTGAIMILSNHIIATPGQYGISYTTPGGKGSPFHSSVRIELLKSTPIKLEGKERPIGTTLRARIAKNSIAPPFGECEMELFWNKGINPYSGLLDIAVDLGIIKQAGSRYYYGDISFFGKDFSKVIQEHPELLQDTHWTQPYFL